MKQTIKIGSLTEINRIGFGTMRATTGEGVWGDPTDRKAAINIIRKAVEAGANFIDTADAYGPGNSELTIAEALQPFKNIVVATKGGSVKYAPGKIYANGKPDYLKNAAEQSLKRLNIEAIDLYYLHRPDPEVPFEESIGALKELQDEGKIKHIGISNVDVDLTKRAMNVATISAVQHSYNILNRKNEALVKFCNLHNIPFVAYYPTANFGAENSGNEFDKILTVANSLKVTIPQLSLAWLLNRSDNIISIAGTSSEKHLLENMQASLIDLSNIKF
jgi:aryl-alcohol dehydrogenase-like predicted oxidoreductase